jgi:uncharacterized protein GlcG (DUF336 family)
VLNTSQGPLWEINTTNRGGLNEAYDAGMEIPRLLNPDGSLPNPGFTPLPGGVPLFKRTLASGSIINRRLVGAIGVYMMRNQPGVPFSQRDPLPEEAEIAAFSASRIGNPFRLSASNPTCNLNQQDDYTINGTIPVQSEGGVFLVGILLAYLGDRTAPINTACALSPTDPGVFPGDYDPALTLSDGGRGRPDPSPWLISPRDSFDMAGGGLSRQEVETIILQCVRASERTHAAIRLPAFSPCQMIIAVSDFDGTMLGVYREPDATLFSLEVSVSKARNAYYYSNPNSRDVGGPNNGMHPLASVFPNENASGVLTGPVNGIAVTARSFGFLTQPSFPPTIDGSSPGPLRCLIDRNATAQAFDKMGFAPPDLRIDSTKNPGEPGRIIRLLYPPGQSRIEQPITDPNRLAFYRDVMGEPPPTNQSGIVFFPGSAPLYRNGQLVGGIGVSGDGVEQDDIVTAQGIIEAAKILGFEIQPPPSKRCDRYNVQGVRVPYWKFPQNPRG